MLDILISRLKEEIAIDGSSGCCIDQVWEYVETISKAIAEESGATITPLVDEKYKAFIWNYLKLEKELEFYENIATQDPEVESQNIVEEVIPLIDTSAPELEEPVIELIQKAENTTSSGTKRKTPPKSKKKSTPKKKPAKKAKKPAKKKKKVVVGDSDDDYDAAGDSSSSSSSSESDFDGSDESEDISSEAESEEYASDEDTPAPRRKPNPQLASNTTTKAKTKKKKVKTTLKIIEKIRDLTYEEIAQTYGSRLYVTGSIELQEQQLYIGIPPGANLSTNLVFILQEILKTRTRGLLQADITKVLGIDSRSTGHYCKTLEEKGAIIRNGVSTHKMRTNCCIHARYASKKTEIEIDEDDDDIPYNVNSKGVVYSQSMFHDALIDLMKDAPNNIILSEDIMRALGFNNKKRAVRKWYNRTLNELCEKGYIMKTNVKFEGFARPRRCIQLLVTPQSVNTADELPVENCQYPIRISGNKNDIPILSFPVDCTMESQLLQVLMVAGENGCTQKELEFALNTDDKRVVYRMLEKMCEMTGIGLERFGAKRLIEFEGKLRRYRYYTYAAYKKMHENIDLIPPLLPDEDSLGFTLKEKDLFVDVPHVLRAYQKFMLQSRKDLGLTSKPKMKKLADGTEVPRSTTRGRPRKTPLNPNDPNANTKGRPRKTATPAASTSNEAASSEAAANTLNNNTTIHPVMTTVFPADASVVEKLSESVSAATPAPANVLTEPSTNDAVAGAAMVDINPQLDITPEINTESNVPVSSNPPISTSSTIVATNTSPTTLVRRRQSSSSDSEEAPSKKPKQSDDNINSEATTAPITNLTPALNQNEPATSPVVNKPVQESTPPPVRGTTNRKRTIADYFTKSPRPSVEPSPPVNTVSTLNTNVQTSESSIKHVGNSSQPVESNVATSSTDVTGSSMEVVPLEVPVSDTTPTSKDTASVEEGAITSANVPEKPATEPHDVASIKEGSTTSTTAPEESGTGSHEASTENSTAEISTVEDADGDNSTREESVAEEPITEGSKNEPTAIQGPPSRIGAFKRTFAHKNKQVNIYMEIRMKVLLTILEDYPMWEIGKNLRDAYIKKATELSGPPKYVVCAKTLWRSASTLAERGQAKIDVVECVLLTGAVTKRKILLHINVDTEGEEYAIFKRNLQDRRTYQQPYYITEKVATVDTPVESLEDRIDRMKLKLEELVKNDKISEAKALQLRIDELSQNAQKFKSSKGGNNMSSWVITGIQFGWIRARMIRIKLLYTHIFKILTSKEDIEGVDKENRRIAMSAVINTLPLNLFCNIIGIFDIVPAVVQYVRNPENATVTYQDMPNTIREELFSNKNKFRRRLRSLFYGLEFLGLVKGVSFTPTGEVVPTEKYSILFGIFDVERVVAIRDVKRRGRPVAREHTLDSMTDVTLYWSEVQFICTHVDEELAPEDKEPEPTDPVESECWKSVCFAPGWSSASVYTRGQRKILNSYVDKAKGTTPLNDYGLCADIAEEINTSVPYVRRYFAKVEMAIERKRLHREEKALERRLKPVVTRARRKPRKDTDGRRVINLSSTRAFRAAANIHRKIYPQSGTPDQLSNSGGDLPSNGGDAFMDSVDDVPVLSNSDMSMRLRRGVRQQWPAEDDELLIYSYVILRHRAPSRNTFRWTAIQQIFPARRPESCRHRLTRMLTDTVYMEQLETATTLWNRFFEEGMQSGEIENPNPREMVDFDLLSYLTYFLKRLNDEDPLFKQIILPASTTDINKCYTVTRGLANANPYYHEDRFYNAPTLISRMATLYHQSLSARRVRETEYDTNYSLIEEEDDIENRNVEILKVFSMMCLLTPVEVYDPFYAHYAISLYPKHHKQLAIDDLRARGALINAKGDRTIPDSKYGLSARLGSLMVGKLPENLFKQAKEYYKYLSEQETSNRFLPEFVSSGMMACLLSLASENKLEFNIANKASKMKAIEHAHFHSRLTDRSLIIFDLDVQLSRSGEPSETPTLKPQPDIVKIYASDFDLQFNGFLQFQPENVKKHLQVIVDALKARKSQGLDLYQLKLEFDSRVDDSSILYAVELLLKSDPPMVIRTGFGSARYVLSPYIKSWTISNEAILNFAKINSTKPEPNSSSDSLFNTKIDRKPVTQLKLWNDVNGFTTDVVIKDCKAVVKDYILRRPGISDANIYRHFSMAFSRVNLQELLELLVEEKIIRKVCVVQTHDTKARKSIFSKTNSFRCTAQPVIEKSIQTCYWANSPYS